MMTTQTMPAAVNSDEKLVEWSLTGDRNAFRQIVERYQSLVCSITYNATGSLTLSEDLAQDTFVAAWKQLSELREPAHLRAWLCGIARFLVGKELRRQGREPVHAAESLEAIHDPLSPEPSPSSQAVTREEEAILWRALERIPDAYRQPLILFYREHQSVERVAVELDLSEDAVKQRLSRGRKLLHEEVIAFVEGTLTRTAPGQEFSGAVLAALPMAAASTATATAGAAAKGAGASKFGLLWTLFAPFVGLIGGMTVSWMSVHFAPNERERRVQTLTATVLWSFVLGWCLLAQPAVKAFGSHHHWSDSTWVGVMAGFWWFYAAVAALVIILHFRRILAIRGQLEASGSVTPKLTLTGGKRLVYVAGLYLALFSWLIYLAWDTGDRLWAWIIAAIMITLFAWRLYQGRGKAGVAAIRMVARHFVLAFAAIFVVLNLRMDVWVAERRDVSVAQIHQLLPIWLMPLLSLALVVWVALVIVLTNPTRRS
ncbi:MAG: sigma-70 family RNA polymerase sigma factor [Verrucomicrobiia bacterium]|jgi:RNA polymerase sigma factor (sigma-70 family)